MSVSLDRLYHFLQHICDTDMIIYHWYPHGSRKLEDLITTFKTNHPDTILYEFSTPHVIFHDQEPLNVNYWADQDCLTLYRAKRPPLKFLENIDSWIGSLHLRCCLTAPFNIFKNTILVHSEKNSKAVRQYQEKNFIPVYYWCHALIARDWFRYAALDPKLKFKIDSIKTDFLIYNRAWSGTREYRLKFADLLIDANLIQHCNIRFNAVDDGLHYTNHQFVNSSFEIHHCDIEDYYPHNTHDSAASADYNSNDYSQCGIEVILETLFDDTRHHLTEKSLRAIACGRPFILAATPGSLQYLRDYGFKTFSPWINEDYDLCNDPLQRLTMITEEMQRISRLSVQEKKLLWQQLYNISEHNKTLFFSDSFHDQVINEYLLNMNNAMTLTYSQRTAEYKDKIMSVVPPTTGAENLALEAKILEFLAKFRH